MKSTGAYSLQQERYTTELQQAFIRILLAVITSFVLIRLYIDSHGTAITLRNVIICDSMFLLYSISVWILLKISPSLTNATKIITSLIEVFIISYLILVTIKTGIPFYLWYIYYVVTVATRYGWQLSVLSLSASIVSFTWAVSRSVISSRELNIPFILGFTGFLLVLAFMFGQISERQLAYQAGLAIVNEFRAELSAMTTSSEIIAFLLQQTSDILNSEKSFFLPAKRGADASEAPGLRSAGADPAIMSAFRENPGIWQVDAVLQKQRPMLANKPVKEGVLSAEQCVRLGVKNIAAAPLIVRSMPIGVIYTINHKEKRWSNNELRMLGLIATQTAPVLENALLWERLREAAASEERLRIARDLHDHLLQTLAAIKLHLERCKILIDKDTQRAQECTDRLHDIATQGMVEVREYLSELRMMEMPPNKFKESLDKFIEDIESRGDLICTTQIDIPDDFGHANVLSVAFTIIRELLNNAATHSKASNVNIRMWVEEEYLYFEVSDDGKGFDVNQVRFAKAADGHLGLIGIEERARQLNGELNIISELGVGTTAKLKILLKP